MQSKASTVEQYLAELPPDRRAAIATVRRVILDNLDKGFQEGMQYGMIGYSVPHSIYPAGYHCDPNQPLPFAGLASQKNYMSVYLCNSYMIPGEAEWFLRAWKAAGKKLDMGKVCIRFKKVDDLALDVIAESIRRVPLERFIKLYELARETLFKRQAPSKPTRPPAASAKPRKSTKKTAKKTAKQSTKKAAGKSSPARRAAGASGKSAARSTSKATPKASPRASKMKRSSPRTAR